MEKKNEFKAGLFVLVGLGVVMATILVLSGGMKLFYSEYELQLKLKHVQGLGINSIVSLNGLKIGYVTDMMIADDQNGVILTLSIEERFREAVREDSTAELKTQGALGDKYIFVTAGTSETRPLNDLEFIKASESPDIFELIASKGSEIGQIGDAVKELRILLANLNADGNSKKVMSEVTGSMAELRGALKDLRGDDKALASAIKRLNGILTKIDTGQGTLGALVNDRALYERLMSLVGTSEKSRFLKPLIRDTIKKQDELQRK